jgi:hypothetical protein
MIQVIKLCTNQTPDELFVTSSIFLIDDLPRMILVLHEGVFLGLAVCTPQSIPDCDILAVVIVEIEVVHCVACCTIDNRGGGKVLGVILSMLEDIHDIDIDKGRDLRISTVQTVTKTNSPRYATFCSGKRKGKMWYGRLCDHPSRG